jgi:hypothetical protein
MNASDLTYWSFDASFVFEPGSDPGTWLISDVPQDLYDFDTSPAPSEKGFQKAIICAFDLLLAEGSIDQATYNVKLDEFGGGLLPGDTIVSDVKRVYWTDYDSESEVTSFNSSTATKIAINVLYNHAWNGTAYTVKWYNQNGTTLIITQEDVMHNDSKHAWSWIGPGSVGSDGETMPADTYRVVYSLADGTVIADESVVCYSGDTMASDVDYFYWFDFDFGTEVTSFDSSTATSIEFDIVYNQAWDGTAFTVDWYNQNGTNLIFTVDDVMQDGWMDYYAWIIPGDVGSNGETMPADTYRVVFSLADGTVIADESVVCY